MVEISGMSPTQNSTLPKNQFQTRPRMYTLAFPKPCQKGSASKPFPTPVTSNWPRTKHQYHLVPTTLLRYAGIKSSSSLNYMFNREPISILFPFPDDPEPRFSPSGGSADLPSATLPPIQKTLSYICLHVGYDLYDPLFVCRPCARIQQLLGP